jgi:hypothetical protein
MHIAIERQDGSVGKLHCPARPFAFTQEEGGEYFGISYQSKLVRPAAVFFEDGAFHDFVLERLGQEPRHELDRHEVEHIHGLLACRSKADLERYLASD